MLDYILKKIPIYKMLLDENKHLKNVVNDYENRIKLIEKRYLAYDKRLDYFDIKIQELENIQSEIF